MLPFIFWGFALLNIAMLIYVIRKVEARNFRVFFLWAILFSLTYDNLAIAYSDALKNSDYLEAVSRLRFVFHATVLPFLTLFALSALKATNAPWKDNQVLTTVAYLFTAAALYYGISHEVINLQLGVTETYGYSRLTNLSNVPPLATIATNAFVIILAAITWKVGGPKWMFVGATTIFVINGATASADWGLFAGNAAEVLFIYFLIKHEQAIAANI